jgi:hypothetical protein
MDVIFRMAESNYDQRSAEGQIGLMEKEKLELKVINYLNLWSVPGWAFLFSLSLYFGLAFFRGTPWALSNAAYFNYLADAFLHGQLFLRVIPASVHDLSFFHGKYFLYWPPFPAIFLIPFVFLFGLSVSDVLITIFISSINVGLVAEILESGQVAGLFSLSKTRRSLLVLFFCAGTVQLVLAPNGRVWFTAQEIGFLFIALTYVIAIKFKGGLSFFFAGICMACAFATRNHLILAGFWPAWYLVKKHYSKDYKQFASYLFLGLFPVFISGVWLIYYNIARFNNPLELGIKYHQMAPVFIDAYAKYGAFSLHYVPINFFFQYIYYPFFFNKNYFFQGGSLFLLSPLFFAFFSAIWYLRRNPSLRMLFITILLVDLPILLLMGTGWVQFGPRYSLDFTVPLLMATAMGLQRWNRKLILICFTISCIHFLVGYFLFRIGAGA